MKLYKKFKGSVKVGLVSGAVCAATSLALPTFAMHTEPPSLDGISICTESDIPKSLEQVTSFEEADKFFYAKLDEYASDNLVSYDEISNLKAILEKKMSFIKGDKDNLKEERKKHHDQAWAAEEKLQSCKKGLRDLQSQKKYTHPTIEKVRTDLVEKVISHYPGLIEKDTGLIYSADTKIKPGLAPILKEMIVEIHEINKTFYDDNNLELLTQQEDYTLSDLAAFYKVLHKKRLKNVCFNEEELKDKESELIKKRDALKIEIHGLWQSTHQIDDLLGAMNNNNLDQLKSLKANFDAYIESKQKIDDFKKDEKNQRKQIGVSVNYMKRFSKNYSSLEEWLKEQGYKVKVERFENTVNMLCPWPWWINTLFGAIFPVFRNICTAKFVGRKLDEFDGIVSVLEPLAFSLALDGIHPLVYPIRLLGMPVLLEPLRKVTGARTLK